MFIIYVLMCLFVMSLILFFTLSVVGNLVVLVYHVNSVLYSNWNSTPILKSFSMLHSNGRSL